MNASVTVGIIDDGFDPSNPYLHQSRIGLAASRDFVDGDTTSLIGQGDAHGEAVLGILAGTGTGGVVAGSAPDAEIDLLRISYSDGATFQAALRAAGALDVVNCSWGLTQPFSDSALDAGIRAAYLAPIESATISGRGGLGTVFVFAGGNGAQSGDSADDHALTASPDTIAVAAVDSHGRAAAFSDAGECILVAAQGVSVTTTDRPGAAGYTSGNTVTASGTSFSAPVVAGVVAEMLTANPALGYRDVQTILAMTARNPAVADPLDHANGAATWNGGGLTFARDIGFGIVGAKAAVALAATWTAQSDAANLVTVDAGHIARPVALPDVGSTDFTFTVGQDVSVEHVLLDYSVSSSALSQLTLEIVSPDGTVSPVLLHPSVTSASLAFEGDSVAFLGEHALGTWTVRALDATTGAAATILSLGLTIEGGAASADDTYVYTNDYATTHGGARSVLADATGVNTINVSAVTTGAVIDLSGHTTGEIAGAAFTVAAGTVVGTVWGTAAADHITAGDLGATLHGGGGDDRLTGGAGNDVLDGGAGNDVLIAHGGVNTLHGGAGIDVAVLDAAFCAFTMTDLGGGVIEVAGAGADDRIDGVESLLFTDGSFDVRNGSFAPTASAAAAATVTGTAGNDTITIDARASVYDGGAGFDTAVFHGTTVATLSVAASGDGLAVTTPGGDTVDLRNFETIRVDDGILSIDHSETAQEIDLLYKAVLARAPDLGGMGYWVGMSAHGVSLSDISQGFADSVEFGVRFGNVSTGTFIEMLYENALGRAAEKGGFDYWAHILDTGLETRGQMLTSFVSSGIHDSPEMMHDLGEGIVHPV